MQSPSGWAPSRTSCRVFRESTFLETDLRVGESFVQVDLTTDDGLSWKRERFLDENLEVSETRAHGLDALKDKLAGIVRADGEANPPVELPVVAFYDTGRAVLDESERGAARRLRRYAVEAAEDEVFFHGSRKDYSWRYAALARSARSARRFFGSLHVALR